MGVYTKTGDNGTTSLAGGERVSKCDARVEAYGTVDELSAHLAMLSDMMGAEGVFADETAEIARIQQNLMAAEAELAAGRGSESKARRFPAEAVARLEASIDRMDAGLKPVMKFVIPGGHPIVSQCNICRTVCRRAERTVIAIPDGCSRYPEVTAYLNRLSDWLYVAGRKAIDILSINETYWTP